jgi:U2 small nuclear ribonucleoprotein A'
LPNALAVKLSTSTTAVPAGAIAIQSKSAVGKGGKGRLMTPEEKKRVVEALTRAKTADEVRRLERMLAEGLIPEGEDVESSAETAQTTEVNGQ